MSTVVRATDYSIQAGHVASTTFTSNHQIVNFPVQTDQGDSLIPWACPIMNEEMYPAVPEVVVAISAKAFPNGALKFAWTFDKWTPLMWKYWNDTFLAGGIYSANVTVKTYDLNEQVVYLQCHMIRPRTLSPIRGAGFQTIRFDFKKCVAIAPPP